MEPLGDELVEDQETVLSLSKNFPALHSALHGSGPVPGDIGAASEPAASQLIKPSPACQQLSSKQVSSFAQMLFRGRPEPDSSSSDSITSNWSKLHFFKKMLSEYTIWRENLVKTQKRFCAAQKNIFIRLQNLPKAYLAGPPL